MITSFVLALVILLLLSALFAMIEASFLAVNKVRLRHLMQRGSPSAKLVYQLLTQLDRVITTVLVGNNLVNVIISVLGTMVFVHLYGPRTGAIVATVLIALVLLVVGEITPKLFAVGHADRVAMILAWPLRGLIRLMSPLVWLFSFLSQGLLRIVGGHRLKRSPLVTEEELKVMMEMGREAGVLAEGELRMLHRIFEFSDSVVREVMVPREAIAAIDLSAKPDEVLDVLIEEGHARIPVYRESLDQVVGVLYARDVLAMARHGGLFVLADLIRPVATVSSTKRIAELLSEFQQHKTQIAIVKDARGKTVGLVTIEDLLEEIVGEIQEDTPHSKS